MKYAVLSILTLSILTVAALPLATARHYDPKHGCGALDCHPPNDPGHGCNDTATDCHPEPGPSCDNTSDECPPKGITAFLARIVSCAVSSLDSTDPVSTFAICMADPAER